MLIGPAESLFSPVIFFSWCNRYSSYISYAQLKKWAISSVCFPRTEMCFQHSLEREQPVNSQHVSVTEAREFQKNRQKGELSWHCTTKFLAVGKKTWTWTFKLTGSQSFSISYNPLVKAFAQRKSF